MARKAEPDLVLMKMHLPDMTGSEVLAALRDEPRTAELRGVAISANALPVDRAMAMELGALDDWTKPLELAPFLAGISALLNVRVSTDQARTPRADRSGARRAG